MRKEAKICEICKIHRTWSYTPVYWDGFVRLNIRCQRSGPGMDVGLTWKYFTTAKMHWFDAKWTEASGRTKLRDQRTRTNRSWIISVNIPVGPGKQTISTGELRKTERNCKFLKYKERAVQLCKTWWKQQNNNRQCHFLGGNWIPYSKFDLVRPGLHLLAWLA